MLRARRGFRRWPEICFFGQVSRVSVYVLFKGSDSAKNGALDASVAAHTAENEGLQVAFLESKQHVYVLS